MSLPRLGGAVAVQQDDPLQRIPMSWDQYVKLPERPRAEWVNGVAVIMNAPPTFGHGDSAVRLAVALANALPDLYVVSEVRLWVAEDILRLPDVMVTDSRPQNDWAVATSEPPLMVAEVLSPSTRSEDVIVKALEYARAGIGQYWILDLEQRTLEVLRNVEGAWHRLAILDEDDPELTVVLADLPVSLDLRQLPPQLTPPGRGSCATAARTGLWPAVQVRAPWRAGPRGRRDRDLARRQLIRSGTSDRRTLGAQAFEPSSAASLRKNSPRGSVEPDGWPVTAVNEWLPRRGASEVVPRLDTSSLWLTRPITERHPMSYPKARPATAPSRRALGSPRSRRGSSPTGRRTAPSRPASTSATRGRTAPTSSSSTTARRSPTGCRTTATC